MELIELKPGWFVRPPYPMTEMEMRKWRFDPITMAIVAGTVVSAVGAYQAGQAAEEQGKAEQAMADYNAKLKEREAEAILERSRAEAEQFEREGEALQGAQQVALAKGGVLAEVGTPALLLEETAQELDADRMMILKEGFLGQSFARSEAEGLRFQGRIARARGKSLKTASRYQAAGTLLTGLGSAAYVSSAASAAKAPAGGRSPDFAYI